MPKKKHYTPIPAPKPAGRGYLKTGRLSEVKIKPLSAAEKQKKANIEADRLMAKRRAGRVPVKPTPLTPAQIRSGKAKETRERFIPPGSNPFGRLAEEMKKAQQRKNKKKRKR